MINRVEIANFKLHEESSFDFAPVTIFIGANNTGKSSVFQALTLLKGASIQSAGSLFAANNFIDLGSFADVAQNPQNPIKISLSGWVLEEDKRAEVSLTLWQKSDQLSRHSGKVSYALYPNLNLRWDTDSTLSGALDLDLRYPPGLIARSGWEALLRFPLIWGKSFQLVGTSELDLPLSTKQQIQADFDTFYTLPTRLIQSICAVYPLRGLEEPGYPIPEEKPGLVESKWHHERSRLVSGVLHFDRDMEEKLSEWSESLFGFSFKVSPKTKHIVDIKIVRKGAKGTSLLINEGSGANQLPYIVLPLFFTPPGGSLIIYEPEAHLHPRGQSEITKILLKSHLQESKQLLIETHSEHILHSFLYAVKKGDLKAGDLAIYYFDEPAKRKVNYRRLEVTEGGQVRGGLPGFYDQALEELREMLEPVEP
jgi:predicted ATPase